MNTIGIIGAMHSELHDIRKSLGDAEITHIGAFDFYTNILNEKTIVNVCCGVGKVNAAICTQMLIDRFGVDYIINTGIAGGMNDNIKVCDMVISSEVISHDVNLTFLEKYPPYCSVYTSDDKLIKNAVESCTSLGYTYYIGRIVSGEQFISDRSVKDDIQKRLNPYAVDMESSAIGHCAYVNVIPSISIRCISDNADGDAHMSFEEFEKIAAKRVANVVLGVVNSL